MKILVLNGPNINMLGIREPDIYGKNTFKDLLKLLDDTAKEQKIELEQYQSNHEGSLVDEIQAAYQQFDGIVINPAAYTHTSIAILDFCSSVGNFSPRTKDIRSSGSMPMDLAQSACSPSVMIRPRLVISER